jgi:hypothetical protein
VRFPSTASSLYHAVNPDQESAFAAAAVVIVASR